MHEFKTTVLILCRSALVYTFVLSCGAWYLNVVTVWQVFGLFQRIPQMLDILLEEAAATGECLCHRVMYLDFSIV